MHYLECAGAVCNCVLPESLKIDAVRHDPDGQAEDSEKRRLTGAFSCFSSLSLCQRHFSTSSLFQRSPTKGTSWDTKQSTSARLKKSWKLRTPTQNITFALLKHMWFFYQQSLRQQQSKKAKKVFISCAYLSIGLQLRFENLYRCVEANS